MNLLTAGLLAVSGLFLISLSVLGLRRDHTEDFRDVVECGAFSPDDSLLCSHEVGHYGWHRSGGTSWFGDSWDCDHWAETQERPQIEQEPTLSVSAWLRSKKPVKKPVVEESVPDPRFAMFVEMDRRKREADRRKRDAARREAAADMRPIISVSPELAREFGSLAGAVLGWFGGVVIFIIAITALLR